MNETVDLMIQRAEALADARRRLTGIVETLKSGMDALRTGAMPELRAAIHEAGAAWQALEADIQAHPELFERPRTMVAHGIRFGWGKSKGSIDIPDPDKTVRLIEKHLPDQAELLIDVTKTPSKAALANLPAADLKRIGCEIRDAGDRVVIAPADGETDKLVRALLKPDDEAGKARKGKKA